ncbi:hypothetical protein FS749_012177 [Ceratobasidium sp. UAMH 11750]|nr:hypothetical protein FS749_012177 [Ceratobasidium sp. UAMH 11750]
MHTLTLNFNPFDCTCWLLPNGEYCAYCEAVYNTALQDFECSVGDWLTLGEQSVFKLAQEAEHQAVLAEFFKEGQAPTPPPVNYMEDIGEELPGAGVPRSERVKGKGKENWCPRILAWGSQSVDKPYAKVSGKGKKEALDSYLVLLH